jgi:hypothetical protein
MKGPNMKEKKEAFVTVRMPESLMLELKRCAAEDTRTLSAQIMHYIKQGIATSKREGVQA